MKVKLLVSRSGADGSFSPGDVITVTGDEAKRMIEAGQAQPVRMAQEPEKAVKRGRPPKSSYGEKA